MMHLPRRARKRRQSAIGLRLSPRSSTPAPTLLFSRSHGDYERLDSIAFRPAAFAPYSWSIRYARSRHLREIPRPFHRARCPEPVATISITMLIPDILTVPKPSLKTPSQSDGFAPILLSDIRHSGIEWIWNRDDGAFASEG